MYHLKFSLYVFLFIVLANYAKGQSKASGVVFLDINENGIFDKEEKGVKGVCVSNGENVVQTNAKGEWRLSIEEDESIFIIKPSGYAVPLNQNKIPQYFFKYTLPYTKEISLQSVNFPLHKSEENKKFSALFFGDLQARGMREVNFVFHDVVEELIGSDATFGVSLGDIVADDPELMDDVSQGVAKIGISWYNIFGNHDNDWGAKTNEERDDTFEKFFGPSTYAFEYGEVAFIALNDIYFQSNGKYRPHFTDKQLAFVENYVRLIPEDKLIVLMMHAPLVQCDNREKMYQIIQNRKHTFSISGHVHEQLNVFVDKKMGWQGKTPHHHLVNATVCGSWWCGLEDESGIPHATMNDGAPNGYSIITFDGNQYSVRFKAARRPASFQMNIYLPEEIRKSSLDTAQVLLNVFAGSDRSVVEMQIDRSGKWIRLDTIRTIDPECLRMYKLSPYLETKVDGRTLEEVFGFPMDFPSISYHMWKAKLPEKISTGTHLVTVRTTDMYKQIWEASRIFRVSE